MNQQEKQKRSESETDKSKDKTTYTWTDKGYHSKWYYITDNFLLILLLSLTTFAWIDGMFIHKEISIIEICNGQPTTITYTKQVTEKITPPQQQTLQKDFFNIQTKVKQTNTTK